MAKVEKCQTCGSFYNAGIYSSCPYCSSAQDSPAEETSGNAPQQIGILGRISSRIRGAASRNQAASEPAGIPADSIPDEDSATVSESMSVTIAEPMTESGISNSLSQNEPAADWIPPEHQSAPQEEPVDSMSSLEEEISKSSRTVGKYIYAKDGAVIEPVVGWIVGVHGDNYGRSFPLKNGKNRIGRTHEMDVRLMNDESVSRACVATIVYDQRGEEFSVLPGESDSLCYLNGHAIYGRELLEEYDFLEFGDSGLNRYLFVPLCGERFRWKQKKRNTDGTSLENER